MSLENITSITTEYKWENTLILSHYHISICWEKVTKSQSYPQGTYNVNIYAILGLGSMWEVQKK